jgi:hypothetical protein
MANLNFLKMDLSRAQTSIENIRIKGDAKPREIGDAMKELAAVVEKLINHIDEADRERDRASRTIQ